MRKLSFVLFGLFTASAFAQNSDRDFGDLLPDNEFAITNKRTQLKDGTQVQYWNQASTPSRDEFSYKLPNDKGPRKTPFGKRRDHRVVVERTEGKVARVSQLGWTSNEKRAGVESLSTTTLWPDGYVSSRTTCYQNFKHGLFGLKTKAGDVECVTVNAEVCKYIEDQKLNATMVEEINKCSETLNQLATHQESFRKLVNADAEANAAALKKLDKKLDEVTNFYDVPAKTLTQVASIVSRYGSANAACEYLKENNWFKPAEEPQQEDSKVKDKNGQQQ